MAEIQEKGDSGKGGKKRSKKMSAHLDMTPMVDLAFLLLTFFMLTTTFSKPQIMEIQMPIKPEDEADNTPVKADNATTILVGPENKLYYYYGLAEDKPEVLDSDYSANGIRKILLAPKIRSNPKMVVMIKFLEGSRYKNMVDILDEMKITDTGKFAIVDITDQDKELVESKL